MSHIQPTRQARRQYCVNRHLISRNAFRKSAHLSDAERSHAPPVRLSPLTARNTLRNCARGHHYIQNDSLRGDLKLIIINHGIIYRRNWNLVSIYLGRRGHKWFTEDAGTGFGAPGDAARYDAPCWRMFQPASEYGITDWRKWHEPDTKAPRRWRHAWFSSIRLVEIYRY
jgi:hypothetical protein